MNGRIFRIVTCAAACTAAAPLFGQDETQLINKINEARGVARTCPGGNNFAAAPKLTVNSSMANGATAVAIDLSPDNVMSKLAENNYLAFGANMLFDGEVNNYTEFPPWNVNDLVSFWLGKQRSCELLMNPGFTEAKMGKGKKPEYAERLAVVLATPYNAANVADYKLRIFNELNKIRATGVDGTKYPGAKCSSSGPVAALLWNDKMADAAQFHSNDYATNGVVAHPNHPGGDPHAGTKGDTANSRIQAAGCTQGGGENVNFNFGLTPEAAVRSWVTMSAGHCQNVVLVSGAKVAGIGIAQSAALQKLPTGPFVTFNLGDDKGCQAATKTSPSGGAPGGAPSDRISSGTSSGFLEQGQKLRSANGQYELVMQSDGHLCIYKNGQFVWGNGAHGKGSPSYKLAIQADSNVVQYGSSGATWASGIRNWAKAPYTLVMQDDGNLALYDATNRHVWSRMHPNYGL